MHGERRRHFPRDRAVRARVTAAEGDVVLIVRRAAGKGPRRGEGLRQPDRNVAADSFGHALLGEVLGKPGNAGQLKTKEAGGQGAPVMSRIPLSRQETDSRGIQGVITMKKTLLAM